MKKKVLAIVASVLLLAQCALIFGGCGKKKGAEAVKQFGEFSYYGKTLIDYAVKDLDAGELKKLVDINVNIGPVSAARSENESDKSGVTPPPTPNAPLAAKLKEDYISLNVSAKFYEDNKQEPSVYPYVLQGLDYNNIVDTNKYLLNNQIIIRSLTLYPELIDYMESENEKFKAEKANGEIAAPFSKIYSYHTSKTGNVVIVQRAYVEIPATQNGGVGCAYRQDIEMIYDNEHKISKWQSSMGIYTTTPQGTTRQGYILEVDFNWQKEA